MASSGSSDSGTKFGMLANELEQILSATATELETKGSFITLKRYVQEQLKKSDETNALKKE